MYTGWSSPRNFSTSRDPLRRRRLARCEARRVRRDEEEDDVRDERDRDEEHERPEEPADEVADHVVGRIVGRPSRCVARGEGSRPPPRPVRAFLARLYLVQIWVRSVLWIDV